MPHETALGTIAEAWRAPGSTPHIRRRLPANLLYGGDRQAIEEKLNTLLQCARSERGAALRRDAIVLYAIVASYPVAWRDLQSEEDQALYRDWRRRTAEWLEASFGAQLEAVLEHVDERYPHLHAVVLPRLDRLNRINHESHPGYAARQRAAAAGAGHKEGEQAFREGMRRWQDDFFAKVSRGHGHERIGPKRKRFRRDAALARQTLMDALECAASVATMALTLMPQERSIRTSPGYHRMLALQRACNDMRRRLSAGLAIVQDELDVISGTLVEQEYSAVVLFNKGDGPESDDGRSMARMPADWGIGDDIRPDDFNGLDDEGNDDPSPEEDEEATEEPDPDLDAEPEFEREGEAERSDAQD